jgi:hypothetical protein
MLKRVLYGSGAMGVLTAGYLLGSVSLGGAFAPTAPAATTSPPTDKPKPTDNPAPTSKPSQRRWPVKPRLPRHRLMRRPLVNSQVGLSKRPGSTVRTARSSTASA